MRNETLICVLEIGWMAWNRSSAVTWVGTLCDPPTWASHNAVPQTPQLRPATAGCSCAATTCWHESLIILLPGLCAYSFRLYVSKSGVISLILFSFLSGCILVTNSFLFVPRYHLPLENRLASYDGLAIWRFHQSDMICFMMLYDHVYSGLWLLLHVIAVAAAYVVSKQSLLMSQLLFAHISQNYLGHPSCGETNLRILFRKKSTRLMSSQDRWYILFDFFWLVFVSTKFLLYRPVFLHLRPAVLGPL